MNDSCSHRIEGPAAPARKNESTSPLIKISTAHGMIRYALFEVFHLACE